MIKIDVNESKAVNKIGAVERYFKKSFIIIMINLINKVFRKILTK